MKLQQETNHRLLVLCFATLVGACGSTDETVVATDVATADPGQPVAPKTPPVLVEVEPARGTWIAAGTPLTVSGRAQGGTGAVDIVKVGGDPAIFDGERFTHDPVLNDGVNLVGIRAETDDGERAVDGRAFFHGDVHPVGAVLPGALRVFMGPQFLDDDEADLDDVAGLVEATILNDEVLSGFLDPIETQVGTIDASVIQIESAECDLETTQGELIIELAANNAHIEFVLEGSGLGSLLSGPGTLDVERIDVTLFLAVEVTDGKATASVPLANVELTGFDVELESFDEVDEDLSALLEEFARDYVEQTFQELAVDRVGGLVEDFLDGFDVDLAYGESTPIDINATLADVQVSHSGVNLIMDASMSSPLGSGVPFGPLSGSLVTKSTPPEPFVSSAPVAFLVDDDLINQFLFAFWYGGGMSKIEVNAANADELGFDLSGLPDVFQPLEKLEIDTLLPMTVHPRTLDQDDLEYEVALGEFHMTFTKQGGKRFALSVNTRTGFWLDLDPGTSLLKPLIDVRPAKMLLYVGCYDAPSNFDPGSVASLIRIGFPPLLRRASEQFDFTLPGLPVGEFVSLASLADKEIGFRDLTAKTVGPEGNLLMLEAEPVLRPLTTPGRTSSSPD